MTSDTLEKLTRDETMNKETHVESSNPVFSPKLLQPFARRLIFRVELVLSLPFSGTLETQ